MSGWHFPIVILDECSQMVEPLSLLPIGQFSCENLLAVGDPKQLPPTVVGSGPSSLSQREVLNTIDDTTISKTLFVRLTKTHTPIVLRTQYRCHPDISSLSNSLFYDGVLLNGPAAINRVSVLSHLSNVVVCDVAGGKEMQMNGGSHYNIEEVKAVEAIVQGMIEKGIRPSQIGVISPYTAQTTMLRQALDRVMASVPTSSGGSGGGGGVKERERDEEEREREERGEGENSDNDQIKLSTVDAFQGGERDIILVSMVRTSGVGFLNSPHRSNVILSRAKRNLIVV